jgi:S1-C subfamily serine protease
MRRFPQLLAVLLVLAGPPAPRARESDSLKHSVVKIFTVVKKPDWFQPWVMGPQYQASGSGCILKGRRILTNAHVVSDAVFVQVLKVGDTERYTAKVEYVGHDCESALLTVENPAFFEGTVPVEFGELPHQRDKVAAFGFPVGGNELSITEGVVSRIEVQQYVHAQSSLLAIQTDAAINAGNSGGPVFKAGKCVGISFQSFSGAGVENTGYVVPVTILQGFFRDIADGRYDGVPKLGIYTQKMENEALRARYHMRKGMSGMLVTRITPGGSVDRVVKEGDVLMAMAGVRIANDGTIPFRGLERLYFSHLNSRFQVGEKVSLQVLRDGKVHDVTVVYKEGKVLVPRPAYDTLPTYYVHAGLVFTPLTFNYMASWGRWDNVPAKFRWAYEALNASEGRRGVVVLNQVLPHKVNVGYHDVEQSIVRSVNGVGIGGMDDLVKAFERPVDGYHLIDMDPEAENGQRIVLDAKEAQKASREILERFGVPSDRSDDLKEGSNPRTPTLRDD